jgi:hypothetical protein
VQLPWPQMAARKDMFGAEIGQFPVPTSEIKRLRCETLVSHKSRISRRLEFGVVF